VKTTDFMGSGGSVDLIAAALSPAPLERIKAPRHDTISSEPIRSIVG
jgi:hypothetical protein